MAERVNRRESSRDRRRDRQLRYLRLRDEKRVQGPPGDPCALPLSDSEFSYMLFSFAFGDVREDVMTIASRVINTLGKSG